MPMFSDPNNKKKILLLATALVLLPTGIYMARQFKPQDESAKEAATELAPEVSKNISESASPEGASRSSVSRKEDRKGIAVSERKSIAKAEAGKATESGKAAEGGPQVSTQSAVSKVLSLFKFGRSAQTGSVSSTQGSGNLSSLAPSVGSAAKESETAPVALTPSAPEVTDGCVTVAFQRKRNAGCTSDEGCTQMRNLIRIKHENPKSVCIRVNGTPVKFETVKGKSNEFMIGNVAGLKAEITARYCVGKANCGENCVVPKDDFMDSIGGGENFAPAPAQIAGWDSEKADKDADVGAHLDAEMKKELDRLDAPEQTAQVFQDWIRGSENPACGMKQASAGRAGAAEEKVN